MEKKGKTKYRYMIETIPDITKDESFKQDARAYTDGVMKKPLAVYSLDKTTEKVYNAIYDAYMRGLQDGFRTGWKIRGNRKV